METKNYQKNKKCKDSNKIRENNKIKLLKDTYGTKPQLLHSFNVKIKEKNEFLNQINKLHDQLSILICELSMDNGNFFVIYYNFK